MGVAGLSIVVGNLVQDGLQLALSSVVSGEACAGPAFVVADSAPGAIAPLVGTISAHDITVGWAFAQRAVRSAGADVTDAALLLEGIPRCLVYLAGFASKLLGGDANATSGAIVGAGGTFAGITFVVGKALALARLAVALALVGAFRACVATVGLLRHGCPRFAHRAGAEGAVCPGPRGVSHIRVGSTGGTRKITKRSGLRIVVLLGVARALVVRAAGTVAGATVRAVSLREAQGGKDGNGKEQIGRAHV